MNRKLLTITLIAIVALLVSVGGAASQGPGGKDAGSEGPGAVEAIVNSRISYQGVLKQNGWPVTGTRNMVFLLFTNNTCAGGAAQSITKNNVPVVRGLFTVTLDVMQGLFDGRGLWLRVVVAGTNLGCEEILPAPYALSLRPGAAIYGDNSSLSLLVDNTGTGDGIRAFADATSSNYGALYAVNDGTGTGVFGSSTGGLGGYFLTDSSSQYAMRAQGAHGAEVQSAAGTAVHAIGVGGPANDNYGVWATHDGNDGVFGWSSGANSTSTGVTGRGDQGYGLYGFSNGTGQYAGYFGDPIYVAGGCTGCRMSYVAANRSDVTLQPGDLVQGVGVGADPDGSALPVIHVAPATEESAVLGVVLARVNATEAPPADDVEPGIHFGPVGGPAAPGDFVIVLVQGMAQVRVEPGAEAQIGDMLYAGNGGAALEGVGVSLGRALDRVDGDGLVWTMLSLD